MTTPLSLGITPPKSQAQQCQKKPHATGKCLTTLLLGHTDGPAAATGRLGVLTTDTKAPVVAETAVGADLLQALQVITELGVDVVGQDLRVLAVDDITLPVEEPLLSGCQRTVSSRPSATDKRTVGIL
jgi:hypothetical protein